MIFHGPGPNHESPTCRLEVPNISLPSESGTFGICTRFRNSFVSLEGGPAPETEFFAVLHIVAFASQKPKPNDKSL